MRGGAAILVVLLAGCAARDQGAGEAPDAGPQACAPGDVGEPDGGYALTRPDGGCAQAEQATAALYELYSAARCCARDEDCEIISFENQCVLSGCYLPVARGNCVAWRDRYEALEVALCQPSCGPLVVIDCLGPPPPNVRCVSGVCQLSEADAGVPGCPDAGCNSPRCE